MVINPGMYVYNAVDPPLTQGTPAVGTVGGFVYRGLKPLLLTCYHCVKNPHLDFDKFMPGGNNDHALTLDGITPVPLGQIVDARMGPQTDIALIDPVMTGNTLDFNIPGIGGANDCRILSDDDKGKVTVRKYGSKTLQTQGTFVGLSTANVKYFPEQFKRHFDTIIMIAGSKGWFADGGDSGSFIVDEQNAVVGLLFLTDGIYSYGLRPDFIKNAFGITFKPSPT